MQKHSVAQYNPQFNGGPHRNTIQSLVHNPESQTNLFILAHFLLGVALLGSPNLSTLHAYTTLALGIFWALTKPPMYAAYAASYMVGAEVLWRMTGASFFWEGGKYAVILVLGLLLLRTKTKHIPVAPLCYFLLLLPSAILTFDAAGLSGARSAISFNLSGPLALFVSSWFFSNIRLTRSQFLQILIILVAPIGTAASYALLRTLSTEQIQWVDDSMSATSGGFGPNQVSTIMGLGIVAIWLLLLLGKNKGMGRVFLILSGTIMLIQGLLTFSRGGIYAAVLIISFITLHFVRSKQQRIRLLLVLFITIPLIIFVALPALDEFTEGFLATRYTDTNLTNRDVILQEELRLFQDNLLAGVGPGMGNAARGDAAHTELTRMLAEHGFFGVASLLLLIFMFAQRYFSSKTNVVRGLNGSLMLWSLIVMTNAAMRLAAVSFTFGLPFAQIDLDDE